MSIFFNLRVFFIKNANNPSCSAGLTLAPGPPSKELLIISVHRAVSSNTNSSRAKKHEAACSSNINKQAGKSNCEQGWTPVPPRAPQELSAQLRVSSGQRLCQVLNPQGLYPKYNKRRAGKIPLCASCAGQRLRSALAKG